MSKSGMLVYISYNYWLFQMPCVFPDTGLSVAYTSVNKTVFLEKSKNCMSIKITTEGFSSFSFLSHNVESDLPEQHKKKSSLHKAVAILSQ